MERDGAVYIMANTFHGTIYTDVTSNLLQRVYQHREGTLGGFTARYGCRRLVCSRRADRSRGRSAVRSRSRTRAWKVALIEESNPTWRDLAEDFGFEPLIVRKVDPGSSPG